MFSNSLIVIWMFIGMAIQTALSYFFVENLEFEPESLLIFGGVYLFIATLVGLNLGEKGFRKSFTSES